MAWFNFGRNKTRKGEQKDENISRKIYRFFSAHVEWTPATFTDLAEEGFNKNVWVYRCIMQRASSVASVPWLLYKRQNGELVEITDHPLLDLMRKPNHMQSGQEFIEELMAHRLLSGNSYAMKAGPKVGPPRELWTLRPDRTQIIPHVTNYVAAYRYKADKEKVDYPREKVMHIKNFSATDDYYGLSPIAVAARGIDGDNAANEWNTALLQNHARPSGAMVTDQYLSDEQFTRLEKSLKDKYSGKKNTGRPLLLEGGLKWVEMSINPKDMDFINSKKINLKEIAAAFGVPPEMLGDSSNKTYSNFKEARYAFFTETVIPDLDRLENKFNAELVPEFGDDLVLKYNKDAIEALKENIDALFIRAKDAFLGDILMKNEARELLGYSPTEGGDVFYSDLQPTATAQPQEQTKPVENTDNDDDPNDDPDDDPDDEDEQKGFFMEGGTRVKALNLETPDERQMYFKAFDEKREKYYGPAKKKIQKYFKAEQKRAIDAFKKSEDTSGIDKAINSGKKELIKAMTEIYMDVIKVFGPATFNQIISDAKSQNIRLETKDDEEEPYFEVYDAYIEQFITATVAEKVVGISDFTKESLKLIIAKGMAEGESIDQIATRIDWKYLEQIIPNRSEVIARTEVISASNFASQAAARQTGLKLEKKWLATEDGRTRDKHRDADKQKRGLEELYNVGGDELRFPGDPRGRPENVIQCRCAETYDTKN